MKIQNYKGNREVFKKISKESPEGREKVERIKSLKLSTDKNLDDIIVGVIAFAFYAVLGVLVLHGDIKTNGLWKWIGGFGSEFVAYVFAKMTKSSFLERRKNIPEANQLIEEVLQEKEEKGL